MPQHSPFSDGRLLVVAFEGWNDAGEAASGLARRIVDALELDEEDVQGEAWLRQIRKVAQKGINEPSSSEIPVVQPLYN